MPPHRQTLRQELECKFILNVMGVGAGRETGSLPGKAGEDSDCCGDLSLSPLGSMEGFPMWGEGNGAFPETPHHSLVEDCSHFLPPFS